MDVFSNKGKPSKLYQNNKFSQVYRGKTEDTYQCTIRKCNAKLYMDKDGVILKAVGEHIHPPKVDDVNLMVVN